MTTGTRSTTTVAIRTTIAVLRARTQRSNLEGIKPLRLQVTNDDYVESSPGTMEPMALNNKQRERLPSTLKRSPTKAQDTYMHTLEAAEETHGDGEPPTESRSPR